MEQRIRISKASRQQRKQELIVINETGSQMAAATGKSDTASDYGKSHTSGFSHLVSRDG